MNPKIQKCLEDFPFLSYGRHFDHDYIGIIYNSDTQLLSMYVLEEIPMNMREEFLELGLNWWWGSNRQIPISLFLKDKFKKFRPYMKHFNRKDFDLIAGHAVSLQETMARRVRKRQVLLVRKTN